MIRPFEYDSQIALDEGEVTEEIRTNLMTLIPISYKEGDIGWRKILLKNISKSLNQINGTKATHSIQPLVCRLSMD